MKEKNKNKKETIFTLLLRYKLLIGVLLFFTLANNGSALIIPRITSSIIDSYKSQSEFDSNLIIAFLVIAIFIFVFAIVQTLLSMIVSEKIGKDLRTTLIDKISLQTFSFVNKITPEKILTNIMSDVDVIKQFISQGVVLIFTAFVLLLGSIVMLLSINSALAIPIILILPLIFIVFIFIFSKIRKFFDLSQKNIDRINRIISESIIGAPLIRVLNSRQVENNKFFEANITARDIGYRILTLFSLLIPIINFISNLIIIVILYFGGKQVIENSLTFGELTAFYTYIGTLITPIFILGFISGVIFRAFTSYSRINDIVNSRVEKFGELKPDMSGDLEIKNLSLTIGEKEILKNINLKFKGGSKNAIIGPTASGKTQLFNIISGLLKQNAGSIYISNTNLDEIDREYLYKNIGLVFQDSILFNTTIKENLTFGDDFSNESLELAISTAELKPFIEELPNGLDTNITERGSNLSGGQKQRITLSRALILNPKILLLDDFTARVDRKTESKILENIFRNYPNITLIMITQKIEPVKQFDSITLLMEGEVLGTGTHNELMNNLIEYKLINDSQKTTDELRSNKK